MKTNSPESYRRPTGFTLVEVMVTMVTAIIIVGAVLASYMYGMRMMQIVKPKLGASDEARRAISLLTDEVREARNIKLGTGTVSAFTEVAPFTQQVGNSIQVYPTTDTNRYIRYFWDAGDMKLKRTTNGTSATYVVANCVSNQNSEYVFKCQDAVGNILSNNFNNRVISLTLQFYQIEYPIMAVGPGNYYDFYQLRAKITRRTLF
jgi:Tfp pilus assembly protein PilW